jgi:hypothetical protein
MVGLIRISIQTVRPSGHEPTAGGAISHREVVSCPHAMEHARFYLKFLDVLAYSCGVRQGEFPELKGRIERIEELVEQLHELQDRKETIRYHSLASGRRTASKRRS